MAAVRRRISDRIIIAILLVTIFAPLVFYVWGYFAMSTRILDFGYDGAVVRCYNAAWKARIYQPAGRVEAMLIRNRVRVEFDPKISSGT